MGVWRGGDGCTSSQFTNLSERVIVTVIWLMGCWKDWIITVCEAVNGVHHLVSVSVIKTAQRDIIETLCGYTITKLMPYIQSCNQDEFIIFHCQRTRKLLFKNKFENINTRLRKQYQINLSVEKSQVSGAVWKGRLGTLHLLLRLVPEDQPRKAALGRFTARPPRNGLARPRVT